MLEEKSISDLTRGANVIIKGVVTNQESRWSADKHTIYTYVSITINQSLKNSTGKDISDGKTIVLRLPGGIIDGDVIKVSDMPVFGLNEEVFLFLDIDSGVWPRLAAGDTPGDFIVHGWEMGKFTISDDLIQIEDRKERVKGEVSLKEFIIDIQNTLLGEQTKPSYLNLKSK